MIGRRRRKVMLNGEHPSSRTVRAVVRAIQDTDILTEKGGYIFKAALVEGCLYLNLVPTLLGDRRQLHHMLTLGVDSPLIANGFVNTDGSLAVVFLKPGSRPLLREEDLPSARALLLRFCQTLLQWGVAPLLAMDYTTTLTVEETRLLASCPATLRDLTAALQQEL